MNWRGHVVYEIVGEEPRLEVLTIPLGFQLFFLAHQLQAARYKDAQVSSPLPLSGLLLVARGVLRASHRAVPHNIRRPLKRADRLKLSNATSSAVPSTLLIAGEDLASSAV